jgi:catechol 2,3-dioxygenase-like lactoylglutathione lyase family enzyme
MKIHVTSVTVDDQDKALAFYTDILGFVKAYDVPMGEHRWLTVADPNAPDGTQLLLEPDEYPAMRALKESLMSDGIPFTQFAVDNVEAETKRLKDLGVTFTQDPVHNGPVTTAVFDDTCGNLIQIVHMGPGK